MSERATDGEDPPGESLEDLYENAPCGYLSLRPNGRIFKVNRTFSGWIGFTQNELIGKRLTDFFPMAGRIFYETHFAPLLRMQGFFNEVALDLITAEGASLPALINAVERRDPDGKHLSTRLSIFIAPERRRYERELVAARAAAEAARKELQELNARVQASLYNERETSALREQFIAVLGHDLRNPLASIDGGMQLLLRTPLNERATTLVTMVRGSVGRMADLIDDIMDFARGRLGGGLALDRNADEPIEAVLSQIVAELKIGVPNRVIESQFTVSVPVNCDRRRLGQLASNLLGNALTHGATDQPIKVGATTVDGWFELFIANAGDPIPDQMLETIFQPFTRGSLRPSLQGLGLGLYISHTIATAHGGTLQVLSTADETRFTFRMPLEAS